jgi:hypothetical protein
VGQKSALLAIDYCIVVASYHIIKEIAPYQELRANYFLEREKVKQNRLFKTSTKRVRV